MRGCGPHRAALARGGKRAKIVKESSRENSDRKFHVFASNKNKAVSKTYDEIAANLTTARAVKDPATPLVLSTPLLVV